ncbi:uncharacterized protein [Ptychodera flava]|uniref:uncharacterized protein n=1 Tax=Ptychodera flava TaxID=63121 RepID=UPI00396A59E8
MAMSRMMHLFLLSCLFVAVNCWPNTCQYRRQVTTSIATSRRVSYSHRTTRCCGVFCWSRCSSYSVAYRYERTYRQGYRYEYYTGSCEGYCSNYECKGCNSITNCVDTRCSSSSNHYCLECEYDRGGEKQAYALVDRGSVANGACEQRCSWRPDSKFCYPGNCPDTPASCTCAPGFSGSNCLTTTILPTISPCTATLKDDPGDDDHVACSAESPPTYSSLKATKLAVDWTTTYNLSSLSDYPAQYYVNSSGFGIIEAKFTWTVRRGNVTLDGGNEHCLMTDILSAQIESKECNHLVVFNSELESNDILWFQLQSNTSGFVKINNYDDSDIVTVDDAQFYSEQHTYLSNTVIFDLVSPQHCREMSPPCSSDLFSINRVYTKNSSVVISWDPTLWKDDSGINHFSCEAYKLIPDGQSTGNLQQGSRLNTGQSQGKTESDIVLRLPDAGVYSIILSVFDSVGNAAKARRAVMYDDRSSISVSEDNPITVSDAVVNNGVSWLGIKSGQITITWTGHFYNAFHRDNSLLSTIEAIDPPLPAEYDESTGQPPLTRSREAIPNVEGITHFEFDSALSSSGKTQPEWKHIEGQQTENIIQVSAMDGDHISVWLKAFDVMGNTREDSLKIYLDSSPPIITNLGHMYRNTIDISDHVKRDSDNTVHLFIDAHDDESGISVIKWKLLDAHEQTTVFEKGEIKNTYQKDPDDEECTPQTCHCLAQEDLDMCFYPSQSVFLDLNTMASMPEGDVDCTFTVVVYNNAMKQSDTSIQFTVHK